MRVLSDVFALSDMLGVRRQFASLVLDGRFYRLHREPVPRGAPEFAALFGVRRRVEALEPVSKLFVRKLSAEKDRIQAYSKRFQGCRTDSDLPDVPRVRLDLYRRLWFVLARLLPMLRRLSDSRKPEVDLAGGLANLSALDGSFEDLISSVKPLSKRLEEANPAGETLGGDVLLVGQNAFDLNWVPGDRRLRDGYLQVQGEQYTVQIDRKRPLMALDGAFKKRMKQVIQDHFTEIRRGAALERSEGLEAELKQMVAAVRGGETLYRDRERSVICARGARSSAARRFRPLWWRAPTASSAGSTACGWACGSVPWTRRRCCRPGAPT